MKFSDKNAIPKSHYEIALNFIEQQIGSFQNLVDTIESRCGKEPGFQKFGQELQLTQPASIRQDSPEQLALQANVMFHLYNMWQSGKPIYYVTPQLAVGLAKTDLNVDTEFLLSPYREIYVQIEPGMFTICDARGNYSVRGFYVYFKRHDSGIVEIRIMATALIEMKQGYLDDANFYFKLFLSPGKLKDSLRSYLSKVLSLDNRDELERFGGTQNAKHVEEFTAFVVNVLLYLTSKEPDILKQLPINFDAVIARAKSPGKVKKLRRKIDKYTSYPIMLVGHKYEVNRQELDDIHRAGGVSNWKLTHKVKVSAHWRAQWYGSVEKGNRRSERIRIESYTKGPDAAELFMKKKVVR